jgi:hypothetical protein
MKKHRVVFDDFEKYPDVAVMLHHINSGNGHFCGLHNLEDISNRNAV